MNVWSDLYVNMTKCPEKHTYDADEFERCPFCEKIKADKEKKNVPTVKLEKNKKGKALLTIFLPLFLPHTYSMASFLS